MKTFVLLLSCLWGLVASLAAQERMAFEPPEKAGEILARMRAEKFPRIDFEDAKLSEALDFLRMRNAEICSMEGEKPRRFGIRIMAPDLRNRKIANLRVRNITLESSLLRIAELTGSWIMATEDTIEFHPGDRVSPAILASYRSKAMQAARETVIPDLLFDDMNLVEAAEAIYEAMPEGAKADGRVKIFLDASVDQQAKVPDMRWTRVRLSAAMSHLAAVTGHRLRADQTTLRILK